MFCTNCGNELNATDKFCNICGSPTNEAKSSTPNVNKTKNTKFIVICILICVSVLVLLISSVILISYSLGKYNDVQTQMDTLNTELEQEKYYNEIQELVSSVFEERSSSVRGNEDLGSVCLNYVCRKMLDAGNYVASERLGFTLESESISNVEDSLFDTFIVYFENEDNYNIVSSAITEQSSIICDNIEIDGDEAYAYVTVNHIDVYEVSVMSWEDLYGEDTAIDILLSGETGILSLLSDLKQGDLSIFLDGFAENCAIVDNDSTYTNKVIFERNENGDWEIVEFPIELLYAYYGVSMVSVE